MKKTLGLDVGGVIFDISSIVKKGEITTDDEFLAAKSVKGSLESIEHLNKSIFRDSIYLVSKYHKDHGPERMREWLEKQNFYERTGIPRDHLYQCVERHEKAPIVKELGITHFVDDRAEVMSHFADSVPNLYHFESLLEDRNEWASRIPNLIFVDNWKDLMDKLQEK